MRPLTALIATALLGLPAWAQRMPFAVVDQANPGRHDVIVLDEATGALQPGPTDLRFRSLELVGRPAMEALRADRPTVETVEDGPERVRLPGGGSLWLVDQGGSIGLLHVDAEGLPSLILPGAIAHQQLLDGLHVSTDGCQVLLGTTTQGGGDVWLVDLVQGEARLLTADLPPLSIEPTSLRVGLAGAWWVAEGQLFACALDGGAPAPISVTVPGGAVDPDLALAAFADRVAVVAGDTPAARLVSLVDAQGQVWPVSETPAPVSSAGHDEPLGPHLAVSPDGALVAWRVVEGGSQELYVAEPAAPAAQAAATHVTAEPAFPVYIDIVGVFSFQLDRVLVFLSGDTTLGGEVEAGQFGAAEVFSVELVPEGPLATNLTVAGSGYEPPFDGASQLVLAGMAYESAGQGLLLDVVRPDETHELLACPVYPLVGPPGTTSLLQGLESAPTLSRLGQQTLISSLPEEQDGVPELEVRLDTLQVQAGSQPDLVELAEVPDGLELSGLATDCDRTALGIWMDEPLGLPVLIDHASGQIQLPTWPLMLPLSGPPAFSPSGVLYQGVSAAPSQGFVLAVPPEGPAGKVPFLFGQALPLAY